MEDQDNRTNQLKGTILSGMRPTGDLHVGHFEVVLRNWVKLQQEYECNYFVADWHAITTDTNTRKLRHNSIGMVKDWLAMGVDPIRSTVFVQSQVPEHAELSLALERMINIGTVRRLPTFKGYLEHLALDKKLRQGETVESRLDRIANAEVSVGFLTYPILQAADILMYNATHVPVGEDQLPHIELTRELARRFNSLYGEVFVEPEALLDADVVLLRGTDGRKMSKSYGNDINPEMGPEDVKKRVKAYLTNRKRLEDRGDPYECPVYDLHRVFNRERDVEINKSCREASIRCYDCKMELPALIADSYADYRAAKERISDDEVLDVLKDGAQKAREKAGAKMEQVKRFMLMDYT
ncbi:TPA: tryptophan--tRNA ligase [Candidatus Woesearchaeota archaeon]|nr:tryptophan--tRNA ligase [Candidatus Woesearchaeota archaeon]